MEQGDNQYQSGGATIAPPLKTTNYFWLNVHNCEQIQQRTTDGN